MNGVDHKDRDTADRTVSLKSNRFYLRIFYWLFDGVLHAMYSIIKVLAGDDKAHPWHKYCSKHLGRYKFQMDLANELISQGIGMDWSDVEDTNKKPIYMRRQDYVPCACKHCFFCKNGLTHGVGHQKKGKRRSRSDWRECPSKRAEVSKTTQRCVVCVKRLQVLNPTLTYREIEKLSKQTRLGCTTCDAHVCAGCWNVFEHAEWFFVMGGGVWGVWGEGGGSLGILWWKGNESEVGGSCCRICVQFVLGVTKKYLSKFWTIFRSRNSCSDKWSVLQCFAVFTWETVKLWPFCLN